MQRSLATLLIFLATRSLLIFSGGNENPVLLTFLNESLETIGTRRTLGQLKEDEFEILLRQWKKRLLPNDKVSASPTKKSQKTPPKKTPAHQSEPPPSFTLNPPVSPETSPPPASPKRKKRRHKKKTPPASPSSDAQQERCDEFNDPVVIALLKVNAYECEINKRYQDLYAKEESVKKLRKKKHLLLQAKLRRKLYYEQRDRMTAEADKRIHARRKDEGLSDESGSETEVDCIEHDDSEETGSSFD